MTVAGDSVAKAETKVEKKIVEYDLRGTTASEVRANLGRLAPRDMNGRQVDATTSWKPYWIYFYTRDKAPCVVTKVVVTVKIVTTLPRLVDYSRMPPKLKRAFDNYLVKLRAHEKGHERLMIEAARDIEKKIRGHRQPTCDLIEQKVSALALGAADAGHRANRDYDTRTNHGINQGVRFPKDGS